MVATTLDTQPFIQIDAINGSDCCASPPEKLPVTSMCANNASRVSPSRRKIQAQPFASPIRRLRGNASGWFVTNSGIVLSDGNNTIEGNAGGETAPTTYARK
jgi:hypothetical protein